MHICVRKQRKYLVGIRRSIVGNRAVACRVYIIKRSFLRHIRDYAAIHIAARVRDKLGVRANAHRDYQHIEVHGNAVFQPSRMFCELVRRCSQNESDALAFNVLLHFHTRANVQNRRKYPVRHIHNSGLNVVCGKRLGSFQADKSRTDYQYFHTVFYFGTYSLNGIIAHKCVIMHLIQAVHRRHKRLRTGCDHKLVVLYRKPVVKHNCPVRRIYFHDFSAQHGCNAVLFIIIRGTVHYILVIYLALQPVGYQRAGIGVVFLIGDNRYVSRAVKLAYTRDSPHRRSGVAYYNIIHLFSPLLKYNGVVRAALNARGFAVVVFRAEIALLYSVPLVVYHDAAERAAHYTGITAHALLLVANHNTLGSYRKRARNAALNAGFSVAETALYGEVYLTALFDLYTGNGLFAAFERLYHIRCAAVCRRAVILAQVAS